VLKKYFGLRLTHPFRYRFSVSREQMRQRHGAEFCSIPNASVRQAPAKRMRQRWEANFCSLFDAGVTDAQTQ
jgi:hypothetical protein